MTDYPDTLLHIDGEWRGGGGGETIAVLNPATGEEIGRLAVATEDDLEAATRAARKGFEKWSATPAYERSKIMRVAAGLLRERAKEIARVMTLEQGKPLREAKGEILAAAEVIEWFAEEARRTYGSIIPARTAGVTQMVLKLPVGPVAAFTPWNFPINQAVRKVSAALATGCSVVLKAAEETPASPAELVRAFLDAGVPADVISLVYGDPATISNFLIAHPVIRKISFTGSTAVGKELAALAGKHMKRATMELGGHAPAIVFEDADLDRALSVLSGSKFRNAGQVCVSPTRFLVQEKVFDEFADRFTTAAAAVKVGDGLEDATTMGPLANDRRVSALESLVQDAVEHGAELRTGGRRIGNTGNFFEPTVLANVPLEARVMSEEPFGPLAIINRFGTLEEVITEANRLPYGLASYAFTSSQANAHAMATRVEAGMTGINQHGLALAEVPFGGIKDSGYGSEGGADAVEPYLVTKFVSQLV